MQPIIIPFTPSGLGRIEFTAMVSTSDRKTLRNVDFKLASGSDFTTISCNDLEELGYTQEFLQKCPVHEGKASAAAAELALQLQYITDVSLKFSDRELQGCRIFFALGTKLRSLFGCDILKYFNHEINYDANELRLTQRATLPALSVGEEPIQIYTLTQ
jgi:hypothetical protein